MARVRTISRPGLMNLTLTRLELLQLVTDDQTGPQGETGSQGESAYQIAVRNGFVGTEQEWLDSLKFTIS